MHPDVREAVKNRLFSNGTQHLIWEGIKETRTLPTASVDPDVYKALNR